jgi:hypothetical protein
VAIVARSAAPGAFRRRQRNAPNRGSWPRTRFVEQRRRAARAAPPSNRGSGERRRRHARNRSCRSRRLPPPQRIGPPPERRPNWRGAPSEEWETTVSKIELSATIA